MQLANKRSSGRSGAAIIEFAFAMLVWIPLLVGLINVGIAFIWELEVNQLSRDLANMYAREVFKDANVASSLTLLKKLGGCDDAGQHCIFGFDPSRGNAVAVLSRVKVINKATDCGATDPCKNDGKAVYEEQILLGNQNIRSGEWSKFGTPPNNLLTASDSCHNQTSTTATTTSCAVLADAQKNDPSVALSGFLKASGGVMDLQPSRVVVGGDGSQLTLAAEEAYLVEVFVNLKYNLVPQIYSRSIF